MLWRGHHRDGMDHANGRPSSIPAGLGTTRGQQADWRWRQSGGTCGEPQTGSPSTGKHRQSQPDHQNRFARCKARGPDRMVQSKLPPTITLSRSGFKINRSVSLCLALTTNSCSMQRIFIKISAPSRSTGSCSTARIVQGCHDADRDFIATRNTNVPAVHDANHAINVINRGKICEITALNQRLGIGQRRRCALV